VTVEFEAGVPVGLDGERLALVELLERAAEIGCRHGVGIVDHIEDRIVGLKGAGDIYEVRRRRSSSPRTGSWKKLVGTIHQTSSSRGSTRSGATWSTRASGGSRCAPTSTPTWTRQRAGDGDDRPAASTKVGCGSSPAPRPNAVYDADLASSRVGAASFFADRFAGFIELWSLQSRMAYRIRSARRGRLMYDKLASGAALRGRLPAAAYRRAGSGCGRRPGPGGGDFEPSAV